MPIWPSPKVELCTTDPAVAEFWTDITAYVLEQGVIVRRGRNNELETFSPGTGRLVLNNNDGRFDPTFAGDARNLITNPSAEVDLTGYSPEPGATVTRTTAAKNLGAFGIQVATTNVAFSGVAYASATGIAIQPSLPYTFSAYAALAVAGSHGTLLWLEFYDVADNLVGQFSSAITLASTVMARFSITATAPATAHHARIFIDTNVAGGVWTFYTDNWQLEQAASASTYCDGSQTGCFWEGAANASPSHHGGSPFWPNLRPQNRIKVGGVWASTTYPRYYGYAQGWTPEYPGGQQSIVNLQTIDGFSVLAAMKIYMLQTYKENDGDNLLANPSFENGTDDYAVQNGSMVQSQTQVFSGDDSLAITTTNVALSGVTYSRDENITVDPGHPYTFSLYTWCDTASRRDHLIRIRFYNSAGTQLGPTIQRNIAISPRRWARYYVSAVAPDDADRAELSLMTLASGQGVYTLYTDAWKFERKWVNLDELPAELAGDRINRILDAVGWPTTQRSVGSGVSRLLEQKDLPETSALAYIQLIEQSVNGRFWIDPLGLAKFVTRWDLGATPYTVSQATFGQTGADHRYVDIVPSYDATFVRNDIRLTGIQEGAIEKVAFDQDSQTAYGVRSLSLAGLLVSDNELADAARYILARYKLPKKRFLSLSIQGEIAPATIWPAIMARDISDRITVKHNPPGAPGETTIECFIEGIALTWNRAAGWNATFTLSAFGIGQEIYPAGTGFFILGTSAVTTGSGRLVY